MAHLIYCRKKKNKDRISKLAKKRTRALQKNVKEIDVTDDVLEKGFMHESIQKELNEQS